MEQRIVWIAMALMVVLSAGTIIWVTSAPQQAPLAQRVEEESPPKPVPCRGMPVRPLDYYTAGLEGEPRLIITAGLKKVAEASPSSGQWYEGWNLVAKGAGLLLSPSRNWQAPKHTLEGALPTLTNICLEKADLAQGQVAFGEVAVDNWGPCDAVALTVLTSLNPPDWAFSPTQKYTVQMLFVRRHNRIISAAWPGYIGLPVGHKHNYHGRFSIGAIGAWRERQNLWIAATGSLSGGGTGSWPTAVVVRQYGERWETHQPIAAPRREGYALLRDVNHDCLPEIVVRDYDWHGPGDGLVEPHPGPHVWEETVYKFEGRRFRKVWHAEVPTAYACLFHFVDNVQKDNLDRAEEYATSRAIVQSAVEAGIPSARYWSAVELSTAPTTAQPVRFTLKSKHRLIHGELLKSEDGRWRVSAVKAAAPEQLGRIDHTIEETGAG